jgi:hypothetical protein
MISFLLLILLLLYSSCSSSRSRAHRSRPPRSLAREQDLRAADTQLLGQAYDLVWKFQQIRRGLPSFTKRWSSEALLGKQDKQVDTYLQFHRGLVDERGTSAWR